MKKKQTQGAVYCACETERSRHVVEYARLQEEEREAGGMVHKEEESLGEQSS